MIIGICGKSGSGKSTLARAIAEAREGAIHYDIDKIGHHALTIPEAQEEAIRCFGECILTEGKIDRKKLGELVFSSRDRMKELTDITWKHMQAIIDDLIKDSGDKIVILDWILLTRTQYFDRCDMTILVDVPYEVRKARAMQRDDITEEAFALREGASVEYDREKFDVVLDNPDAAEMKRWVKQLERQGVKCV